MLKFVQINSSSSSSSSSNHTYYEKYKNIKIVYSDQQNTNTNELAINTTELDDDSKYSCCLIDKHHLFLQNDTCVYLFKTDYDYDHFDETRSTSYSQSYSKSMTTSMTSINGNNNKAGTKERDSFYGIEYPVLIIILVIFVLIITACIKLSRDKNKKNNLGSINYLSSDRIHQDQVHQQLQDDSSSFPYTFSLVPSSHHQQTTFSSTDVHQSANVYYIKPININNVQLDLPPSYDDVVKTNVAFN